MTDYRESGQRSRRFYSEHHYEQIQSALEKREGMSYARTACCIKREAEHRTILVGGKKGLYSDGCA